MRRTRVSPDTSLWPSEIRQLAESATVYDSSSSPEARVYFLDTGAGYYLKTGKRGTLGREALMDEYFHSLGLGARVCQYVSCECDFLLTERVRGEDCTATVYLSEPRRLAELLGVTLRELHSLSHSGCPVPDRTADYIRTVREGYFTGRYDPSYLIRGLPTGLEEAYRYFEGGAKELRADTLLHGDFCLPNVILDGWRLSGFIDLGCGGVGDRHIDLFWGEWTLKYNLGTPEYGKYFLDAYGRNRFDRELLGVISAAECFG